MKRKAPMLQVFVLLLIVVTASCQAALAQGQKLYFVPENTSAQDRFVSENNLPVVRVIYENDIVTGGRVDLTKLGGRIKQIYTDPSSSGFGVLDWESGLTTFVNQNNKELLDRLVTQYVEVISYAKQLRPNVKWGYYGIPTHDYRNFNVAWQAINENLLPILKKADFIAPSLYTFYSASQPIADNRNYISENMEYSLAVGKQLNKPVYPFVWHRFHSFDKTTDGQIYVPLLQFKNDIELLLQQSYRGYRAAGIIWWSSEDYGYKNRKRFRILSDEYKNVANYDAYQYGMFNKYYSVIKPLF